MRGLKSYLRWAPVVLLAIAVGASSKKLFTESDTVHYLRLAAGEPVMEPFAARQLGPLIVRALTHLGFNIHQGFWLLGVVSLVIFVGTVASLLEQSKASRWLVWSVLGMYFWGLQFAGMVLPDLFYAALLSGFLLLVWARRYGLASAMLLPLMVERESTVLVLACWLIVGWRSLTWAKRLGSLAAVAVGALIVRWLAVGSGVNREGLTPVLYLLGKAPWNFARNFLGLEPWANLTPACGIPRWHHAVSLGPLHDIGFCNVQPEYPVRLVAYALATFGLLPLLLWWVRKTPAQSLLARFCLLYGVTAFLIAGLLGYSVQRLYGYGWPAFLIALPLLANGSFRTPRWAAAFVAAHLCASWLEWRVDKLPLLLGELALWALGFVVLQRGWQGAPAGARESPKIPQKRP